MHDMQREFSSVEKLDLPTRGMSGLGQRVALLAIIMCLVSVSDFVFDMTLGDGHDCFRQRSSENTGQKQCRNCKARLSVSAVN